MLIVSLRYFFGIFFLLLFLFLFDLYQKMMKFVTTLATASLSLTNALTGEEAASILRSEVQSYTSNVGIGSLCKSYTVRIEIFHLFFFY